MRGIALPAAGLAGLLILWELAVRLGDLSSTVMPKPSDIPRAWWGEVEGGYWHAAILSSLGHYAAGLVIGAVSGAALGALSGLSRSLEAASRWVVRVLRPIPGLAWVPFAIIWFGASPSGATFIIIVAVFWLTFFAALVAVQQIDPDLIEMARAFGHGGFWSRLFGVVLPGAAPGILAGLRAALGQAWMAVVAAEMFGIPGVGARMMQAASLLATEIVVVYMLTMALLYAMTDIVFQLARGRILQWQR